MSENERVEIVTSLFDHSILSPSGRMSGRSRRAVIERERQRLFPPEFWQKAIPSKEEQREAKIAQMHRRVETLRELAARGMHPRKYMKEAQRLEEVITNRKEQGDE